MTAYLPWVLLLLACPLMMIFMIRGMGGGHTMDRDMHHKNTDDRLPRQDHNESASAKSETVPADDRGRIAQLEREVADLRAAREHPSGSKPRVGDENNRPRDQSGNAARTGRRAAAGRSGPDPAA